MLASVGFYRCIVFPPPRPSSARRNRARLLHSVVATFALLAAACGGEETDEAVDPLAHCHELAAAVDNPSTIGEAVDRMNLLPSPITTPCVLASLQRPLAVVATQSSASAQPGTEDNPRLFILLDGLVLAVVPVGYGAPLLEFGELLDDQHTVKAELVMPFEGPVAHSRPYERVLYPAGSPATACGSCHHEEVLDRMVDGIGGYSSLAYQPTALRNTPLTDVMKEHRDCGPQATSFRCEMFRALLDFGEVHEGKFPEEMQTIGEQ